MPDTSRLVHNYVKILIKEWEDWLEKIDLNEATHFSHPIPDDEKEYNKTFTNGILSALRRVDRVFGWVDISLS